MTAAAADIVELRVTIDVGAPSSQDAEQERRSLLRQLRSIETYSMELAPRDGESTAKGASEIGQLLLTLAASGGVITSLIAAVQSYIAGRSGRKVILEIDGDKLEVSGVDSASEKKLISAWINRHRR